MTADAEDRPAMAFRPVVTQKATDLIAEQIRQRIFAREFRSGDMLPPEAELVRQTASSSASVRGALRALETQGLIDMRAGRAGGAVVRLPGEDELASTVSQLIRGQSIGLGELLDMQEAIEPMCAGLAADHRDDDDLLELQEALDRITTHRGDLASLLEAHSSWHIAVSRSSHNELLSGLMIALVRWIHLATQESKVVVRRTGNKSYEDITSAIVDGDGERARQAMHQHVVTRAHALRPPRRSRAVR